MLEFININKRYGDYLALDKINLQVPTNKITTLIGPSGCGKSTLLRLILGLTPYDNGQLLWHKAPLTTARQHELRRRTGYVIQDGGLFPHMDVRKNICLMAQHFAWSPDKIAARLQEMCALTHFSTDLLQRFPTQISGGQRQRVSLMRALMLDPELLLLDEPLGALDPLVRFDMQAELKAIFQNLGKTVILVTHDLAEADFFADEIILFRQGHIEQRGKIADFVQQPASEFVSRFVRAQRRIDLEPDRC